MPCAAPIATRMETSWNGIETGGAVRCAFHDRRASHPRRSLFRLWCVVAMTRGLSDTRASVSFRNGRRDARDIAASRGVHPNNATSSQHGDVTVIEANKQQERALLERWFLLASK